MIAWISELAFLTYKMIKLIYLILLLQIYQFLHFRKVIKNNAQILDLKLETDPTGTYEWFKFFLLVCYLSVQMPRSNENHVKLVIKFDTSLSTACSFHSGYQILQTLHDFVSAFMFLIKCKPMIMSRYLWLHEFILKNVHDVAIDL